MDALLLDKAELQQSLVLSRKDLENNKQKSKVKHRVTASALEAQHEKILVIMQLDCYNNLCLSRRNLQCYIKSLTMSKKITKARLRL